MRARGGYQEAMTRSRSSTTNDLVDTTSCNNSYPTISKPVNTQGSIVKLAETWNRCSCRAHDVFRKPSRVLVFRRGITRSPISHTRPHSPRHRPPQAGAITRLSPSTLTRRTAQRYASRLTVHTGVENVERLVYNLVALRCFPETWASDAEDGLVSTWVDGQRSSKHEICKVSKI
ncbi:hypothetical protein CC86DRAFT_60272 [Ophiobolus disseminans]|uniref:Uncharacterized protein n=1 Tax=Ophiobolus disseminans TaxID=1469910 RepID=A0A6A6ZTZ8_9PLEO|nr:hypothetical protein CC86DRAFT_60272 [Ophiobolus disseminans]